MANHQNIMPDGAVHDEREAALLRFREAALIALADPEILEQISLDEAAAALPPTVRAALDQLGTPKQCARRIVAECERSAAAAFEADRTTSVESRKDPKNQENVPTLVSAAAAGKSARLKFDSIQKQHDAWLHNPKIGWSKKYRKGAELGSGGQGSVYRLVCLDDFCGLRALKILSPAPYGEVEAYVADMERMRRVAAVVHQIQHYNLVDVEYFEPRDHIYTQVMRLIDGFDLRRLLRQASLDRLRQAVASWRWEELNDGVYTPPGVGAHRPEKWGLQPGIAVNIIQKCLRGVQALHDKKIVHGDIKPSNIMLGSDGGIRLIDINSAFEISSRPTVSAWTPRYAPPEVLQGEPWTPKSDLASLGYVLIELLSGQPEALGPNASSKSTRSTGARSYSELVEAKEQLPVQLSKILPEDARKSQRLVKLCKDLIQPDPEQRVPSASHALTGENGVKEFKHELVRADLSGDWVEVIQDWVRDVKRAIGQKED